MSNRRSKKKKLTTLQW